MQLGYRLQSERKEDRIYKRKNKETKKIKKLFGCTKNKGRLVVREAKRYLSLDACVSTDASSSGKER
jgi:ribosomal protein L18